MAGDVHLTQQVSSHIFPEGLISQPVHDRTNEAWEDLDDDVGGKDDGHVVIRQ